MTVKMSANELWNKIITSDNVSRSGDAILTDPAWIEPVYIPRWPDCWPSPNPYPTVPGPFDVDTRPLKSLIYANLPVRPVEGEARFNLSKVSLDHGIDANGQQYDKNTKMLELTVDVSDVSAQTLKVTVDKGFVLITGKKRRFSNENTFLHQEISSKDLYVEFELDGDLEVVDKASLNYPLLTLKIMTRDIANRVVPIVVK